MKDQDRVEQRGQSGGSELETICVVYGLLKAQVIRAKLEQAGIPVLLRYESIGPVMGITVDGIGEVQVCVPTGYADEARALTEEQ